jgi:hypothetical protein
MTWFVIERYLHCLTGITYIGDDECDDDSDRETENMKPRRTFKPTTLNMNKFELIGLKELIRFVIINSTQDNIPKQIVEPNSLLINFKVKYKLEIKLKLKLK